MWLAMWKTAKALWDCSKYVLFYYFADDGMFNKSSGFPVRILTSFRSPMVSISKWKDRWHWKFLPAVMKMYPTATPALWCVITLWLCWNVSTSAGYILCIFTLLRTMFHSHLKWFNNGMGIHTQSGECRKKQREEVRKGDRRHFYCKRTLLWKQTPHTACYVNQSVTPPCTGWLPFTECSKENILSSNSLKALV